MERLHKISQQALSRAATAHGLGIGDLSKMTGIKFQRVADYMTRGGTATANEVEKLAAAVCVKPREILTFDGSW